MANSNNELIQRAFNRLLQALAPFVMDKLKQEYGTGWWQAVLDGLWEEQKRGLPHNGSDQELLASLDIQRCLILCNSVFWNNVFNRYLERDSRGYMRELQQTRNTHAHIGLNDFNDEDTWRALDNMARLGSQIDPNAAEDIRAMLAVFRSGHKNMVIDINTSENDSTEAEARSDTNSPITQASPAGLPSWRDVMAPHPDVARGRYRKAEFAADLAQVARGEGSNEYLDPAEFFARTYITKGISKLLLQALKRVSGQDGEPVIQLKTAFGGGKTHTLLALYHLLRSGNDLENKAEIRSLLEAAGLDSVPRVNVAVLVGTALDPSRERQPKELPGVTVRTLWGEIAAQLAIAANRPQIYDFVREADQKSVAPGSAALKDMFNACGPCLILMDEIVAYARRIYGVEKLPAGSFENFLSFIQALTEAARASHNSLVVASIPESNIEIGGRGGRETLRAIQHYFGRMEAVWQPVAATEGFEVVRRRLFLNCKNEAARKMTCSKFSEMYRENSTDFPLDARELEYKNRLISCYPIHPEIFDLLYEEWSTLENFQRTRGVLRFMAAVIHALWMANDAAPLIMPGSLPLENPAVRDELLRYLPAGWDGVVDKEVDGPNSQPWQLDNNNPRYGQLMAARRVARTIMLGSAPAVRQQHLRGLEATHIRLGVIQPGENIAIFNDVLSTLQNRLSYLYCNSAAGRYWYDTRPTLRKTVMDRAAQIPESEAEQEIEARLRQQRPGQGIRLHACPASSNDVPDSPDIHFVILRPDQAFLQRSPDCPALGAARNILMNRGNAPRIFKNMLVFLAADEASLPALKKDVSEYLAWKSVQQDADSLNLDNAQKRDIASNLDRCGKNIEQRLVETWCWLLVPSQMRDEREIRLEQHRLGSGRDMVERALAWLGNEDKLLGKWAPRLLLNELDNLLWKDREDLELDELWRQLCTYCYNPRLAEASVLLATVNEGLGQKLFAWAQGKDQNGRYVGLLFGEGNIPAISGLLVRQNVAEEQLKSEIIPIPGGNGDGSGTGEKGTDTDENGGTGGLHETTGTKQIPDPKPVPPPIIEPKPKPKKFFFLSTALDPVRASRDLDKILQEIVFELQRDGKVNVELTLELQATAADGYTQDTVRAVKENCINLKIRKSSFEE